MPLNLEHYLSPSHKLVGKDLTEATNLAEEFPEVDRKRLGGLVWDGYRADCASRAEWEKQNQNGMDLALQISRAKNFPWPNCSNVMFPLTTIAALQFHARSYSALVGGPDVVKCKTSGADPDGKKSARAARISAHMSYQVLEEDEPWEEQHDRLLINIPIVGTAFKKSRHSSALGHNVSELVLAKDLVMDYYAKSVDSCGRKTHVLPASRNDLLEKMLTGVYIDYSGEAWFKDDAKPLVPVDQARDDKRAGSMPPAQSDFATPFTELEQHCWFDLDGDGYAEPYIITIEASTKSLLRIVARWSAPADVSRTTAGRIYRIEAEEYFTKYGFIPSPDGSVYDIGFGVLLGPLNESVNSLINIMIDQGVMGATGGGFLGKGAKIRGGNYSFAPNEWKRVDSTGDDLAKSLWALPVREPSAVLFNLLGLLINYTDRVSGSTDTMVGENPGQNTPAETTRAMVEQGSKIFGAIFKRTWRSMKWEFKKLFILNGKYLETSAAYGSAGNTISREDYLIDASSICPAADPNMTSEAEKKQQAIAIKQSAQTTPGYDPEAVERKFLASFKVEDPEVVYPGLKAFPASTPEKLQIEQMRVQLKQAELQLQNQQFIADLQETIRMDSAEIAKIQAEIGLNVQSQAGDVEDRQVNKLNAMVGLMKAHNDNLHQHLDHALKRKEIATKRVGD